MNDFQTFEKNIVRELSCRLCLCNDVMKLKPLSAEVKRKIKRLFDIVIRQDDNLPKAICHDCLQQISTQHLYTVKVEKTQKFLEFHKIKIQDEKRETANNENKLNVIVAPIPAHKSPTPLLSHKSTPDMQRKAGNMPKAQTEHQQGDSKSPNAKPVVKKKNALDLKFLEAMSLEEFASTEKVDKNLLSSTAIIKHAVNKKKEHRAAKDVEEIDPLSDTLDPVVIVDGRPAKSGPALDKQITLFYKMECCICHENGFHFRSLMKHYKDRHGVPGYVTCCDKKFHYFYPKKIIEHMAYHLQPEIFMCPSCHHNFQTSADLCEHQNNGGRTEGKIICPRCSERFPTYHELGFHLISHRIEKLQCDYCGKQLKHHHRKKTVNRMEDLILCSICLRNLKTIEKQERETKEKFKPKFNDSNSANKVQKYKQAVELSGDEEASTD